MTEKNIYLPYLMRIAKITEEAPSVRTFRLEFVDEAAAQAFDFKTGQFGLYSAFGEGESTFCIASSPTRKGYIECTFREVGRVTGALADPATVLRPVSELGDLDLRQGDRDELAPGLADQLAVRNVLPQVRLDLAADDLFEPISVTIDFSNHD